MMPDPVTENDNSDQVHGMYVQPNMIRNVSTRYTGDQHPYPEGNNYYPKAPYALPQHSPSHRMVQAGNNWNY